MKTKYPEIYFENSGGEGPLYVYLESGPYGNAVDDETGLGAGFFNENGRLLAVLYDHISSEKDHCCLRFPKNQSVEIKVKNGKVVDIKVSQKNPKKVA